MKLHDWPSATSAQGTFSFFSLVALDQPCSFIMA
jgi:hypothetical protein